MVNIKIEYCKTTLTPEAFGIRFLSLFTIDVKSRVKVMDITVRQRRGCRRLRRVEGSC